MGEAAAGDHACAFDPAAARQRPDIPLTAGRDDDQASAVGGEAGVGPGRGRGRQRRTEELAGGRLPELDEPVASTGGGEQPVVRRERDAGNWRSVRQHGATELLPGRGVPSLDDAGPGARGERPSGTVRDRVDEAGGTYGVQRSFQLAVARAEESGGPVADGDSELRS